MANKDVDCRSSIGPMVNCHCGRNRHLLSLSGPTQSILFGSRTQRQEDPKTQKCVEGHRRPFFSLIVSQSLSPSFLFERIAERSAGILPAWRGGRDAHAPFYCCPQRSAGILPAWSRDGSATLQCCEGGTDFPVRDSTGWKTRSPFCSAKFQVSSFKFQHITPAYFFVFLVKSV